jgi:hypothetical protein
MTLTQATNKIQRLGGFAHIDTMPLEQRNAYAAEQLRDSLSLNATWLFDQANKKGIDLLPELQHFDREYAGRLGEKETECWNWMWALLNKLEDKA